MIKSHHPICLILGKDRLPADRRDGERTSGLQAIALVLRPMHLPIFGARAARLCPWLRRDNHGENPAPLFVSA
jgi:hypothetical protein